MTARNTNRQGANFELQVMHYLDGCLCVGHGGGYEGFGATSLRSSGSRGKVDIVAVASDLWRPFDERDATNLLFIQCKITNPVIAPAERTGLIELANRAAATPVVAFKALDERTKRVLPQFRILTGPGPKDFELWDPRLGWT